MARNCKVQFFVFFNWHRINFDLLADSGNIKLSKNREFMEKVCFRNEKESDMHANVPKIEVK